MGGGSGGSSTPIDFQEIEARALERLKRIAAESTRILFVCERIDVAALRASFEAHGLSGDRRFIIAPHGDPVALADEIRSATLIVAYTNEATSTAFIDEAVASGYQQRKPGMHVRGRPGARIPANVTAYRWRSMSWQEFLELLA